MKTCWCGLILSLLAIVLVWWAPSWADWGITIVAALLAIKSLFGVCCCGQKCCDTGKSGN